MNGIGARVTRAAACVLFLLPVVCVAQSSRFAISGGYTYLNADGGATGRNSLNGWYVLPQVNLSKSWSALADFTNFYGTAPSGASQTIHGFTFGPAYAFHNHSRFTPFLFSEAGDVRASVGGNVTNSFAFVAGGGFLTKLTDHVSLQIVPGEYVLTEPNWSARHNYSMKVGLTFPF